MEFSAVVCGKDEDEIESGLKKWEERCVGGGSQITSFNLQASNEFLSLSNF